MRVVLSLIFFLGFASLSSAQVGSEDFTISVFGGEDTATPTTPVLLGITPVAPTQIDLQWSTSTDNFLVAGYVVTRGTSTIATTTQTTFSDTGLTASTTYAYSVVAFDTSFNYSSSSNVLATTTPDFPPPVVPPPAENDGATEGTVARVVTEELSVTSGVSTTSIALRTTRPVKLSLRWGRTASYEIGYVVKETYAADQAILLTELEPGTTYEFELIAELPSGREQVVERGRFTTEETLDDLAPDNVGRFVAVAEGSDVRLSWELPEDESLVNVRILRSHLGFPAHPQDGAIVYQGLRTGTVDRAILDSYSPVYYTAFVYDEAGNVSSGAVAIVFIARQTETGADRPPFVIPPGERIPIDPERPAEATSTVDVERLTPEMRIPELSEVFIEQGNEVYSFLDQRARLVTDRAYQLVIPAEAVSGNLKTIIGTVFDPTDNRQSYSYLMRLNADRSAYVANVSPADIPGQSTILIEIYDYEATTVVRYQRPIAFVVVESGAPVVFPDVLYSLPLATILGAATGIVLLSILVLLARSKRTAAG